MKIYRIYTEEYEWDYNRDDFAQICTRKTVKYVDSLEKVKSFLQEKKNDIDRCYKCNHCPITSLTKRQYNNGKHQLVIDTWCNNKDIYFRGNYTYCNNQMKPDYNEYKSEEIEVE